MGNGDDEAERDKIKEKKQQPFLKDLFETARNSGKMHVSQAHVSFKPDEVRHTDLYI